MTSTFNDGDVSPGSGPGKPESGTATTAAAPTAWSEAPGSEESALALSNGKRDAGSAVAAMADSSKEGAVGAVRKKKRTDPGSRGVANLTPEQLAKKRANDREAQRAIRERTKNQIELLERRIQELTSQQPYQELQAVVRQKEALERELAGVRRQLASIVNMLQPLIGNTPELSSATPSSGDQASSPAGDMSHTSLAQNAQNVPIGGVPILSTPEGRTSSVGQDDRTTGLQLQRQELRDNSTQSRERLGLRYILGSSQGTTQTPDGSRNARDTP